MNRRNFIQCAGASVFANSVLEAGAKKSPRLVDSKKNLVIFTTEYGFHDEHFAPKKESLESSKLLSFLTDHQNELTVFNKTGQPEIGNGHGNHRGILSLNKKHSGGNETSLDCFIADRLEQRSRYKHVHIGDKMISIDSKGRTRQSWKEQSTQFIYDKLFGDVSVESLNDESQFMQHLGEVYRSNSNYRPVLDNINATFELRKKWLTAPLEKPKPTESKKLTAGFYTSDVHKRGYPTPLKQYFDLVTQGLLCNRGQVFVVSAPVVNASTARTKATVGFHSATHGNGAGMDDVLKYESYMFKGLADFIRELKQHQLLDSTLVLAIGGLNNAGAHVRQSLPTVLLGGGLQHQGIVQCLDKDHLRYPLANIYVSILHQMGLDVNEFAGIQGDVDHLIS